MPANLIFPIYKYIIYTTFFLDLVTAVLLQVCYQKSVLAVLLFPSNYRCINSPVTSTHPKPSINNTLHTYLHTKITFPLLFSGNLSQLLREPTSSGLVLVHLPSDHRRPKYLPYPIRRGPLRHEAHHSSHFLMGGCIFPSCLLYQLSAGRRHPPVHCHGLLPPPYRGLWPLGFLAFKSYTQVWKVVGAQRHENKSRFLQRGFNVERKRMTSYSNHRFC